MFLLHEHPQPFLALAHLIPTEEKSSVMGIVPDHVKMVIFLNKRSFLLKVLLTHIVEIGNMMQ